MKGAKNSNIFRGQSTRVICSSSPRGQVESDRAPDRDRRVRVSSGYYPRIKIPSVHSQLTAHITMPVVIVTRAVACERPSGNQGCVPRTPGPARRS